MAQQTASTFRSSAETECAAQNVQRCSCAVRWPVLAVSFAYTEERAGTSRPRRMRLRFKLATSNPHNVFAGRAAPFAAAVFLESGKRTARERARE